MTEISHNTGPFKILFIAFAQSTHTHAWVDLLKNKNCQVQVFGVSNTEAPEHFTFPVVNYQKHVAVQPILQKIAAKLLRKNRKLTEQNELASLAHVITQWKPDIIHTLGFAPAGFLFAKLHIEMKKEQHYTWIHTSRGGPELTLNHLLNEYRPRLLEVLRSCDRFIADNHVNYSLAISLGLAKEKTSSLGIVPGTGGVDIEALSALRKEQPSRSRIIVYPKAYECPASKALPVFEAFRIAWEQIRPCKIILTALVPETLLWFRTLPQELQDSCILYDRIPRKELLAHLASARIMLAPSLSDGIPNTVYEAMACGTFPIISPLETFGTLFAEVENVLFARNLYPQEIADALITAMNNDELVDTASVNNKKLITTIADRRTIAEKVFNYYNSVAYTERP